MPRAGFFTPHTMPKTKTAAADKHYTPPPECYQGAELKPHPGLPPARMYAYTPPSRMGNRLHYPAPTRTVEPFPA